MNHSSLDLRYALFLWLKDRETKNGGILSRDELAKAFYYKNHHVTLVGPTGIWTPKGMDIPISISTTTSGPYDDGLSEDGILLYRYRGQDINHRDNVGLRKAMQNRTPLVYFHSIKPGKYQAIWPVMILEDLPDQLCVKAAIDPAYSKYDFLSRNASSSNVFNETDLNVRRYMTYETKRRLHQSAFREYVLDAYDRSCAICRLKHSELLDAAHIIPDSHEDGLPIVPNGLSLCKIHHSAFDQNIFGITPDYSLDVREDILAEVDGPMLEVGLKAINGQSIILPKSKKDYPDRDRLAKRYEDFRKVI